MNMLIWTQLVMAMVLYHLACPKSKWIYLIAVWIVASGFLFLFFPDNAILPVKYLDGGSAVLNFFLLYLLFQKIRQLQNGKIKHPSVTSTDPEQ